MPGITRVVHEPTGSSVADRFVDAMEAKFGLVLRPKKPGRKATAT